MTGGERLYRKWLDDPEGHTDRARYWHSMNPADKRHWEKLAAVLHSPSSRNSAERPRMVETVDGWCAVDEGSDGFWPRDEAGWRRLALRFAEEADRAEAAEQERPDPERVVPEVLNTVRDELAPIPTDDLWGRGFESVAERIERSREAVNAALADLIQTDREEPQRGAQAGGEERRCTCDPLQLGYQGHAASCPKAADQPERQYTIYVCPNPDSHAEGLEPVDVPSTAYVKRLEADLQRERRK